MILFINICLPFAYQSSIIDETLHSNNALLPKETSYWPVRFVHLSLRHVKQREAPGPQQEHRQRAPFAQLRGALAKILFINICLPFAYYSSIIDETLHSNNALLQKETSYWPVRFVHLSRRHVKQREAFWLIIGTQTGERHTPFLQLGARANSLESGRHENQENLKVKPFLGLSFNVFQAIFQQGQILLTCRGEARTRRVDVEPLLLSSKHNTYTYIIASLFANLEVFALSCFDLFCNDELLRTRNRKR